MTKCFGGGAKIHSNICAARILSCFDLSVRLLAQNFVHRNMDFTVGPSLHHLFGYQISMLQMRYMCVRNFFMLVKGSTSVGVIDAEQPRRDLPVPM